MVWGSDITLLDIVLFIILVGLPYTLLLTALSLAGGFILRIILAIMRVYGGMTLIHLQVVIKSCYEHYH